MSTPTPQVAPRDGATRRGRGVLTRDAIVEATLRIIDTEGIDEVSMRRVATEFDTGPASLYAHVANKDELLRLALEQVLDRLPMPVGETWQEVLRSWAHKTRALLSAHNDIARLTFGTVAEAPRINDVSEKLLGAMIGGGVPPQVAAWTLDVMSLYVASDVYEGWLMSRIFDDGSGRPTEEVGMEYFHGLADRMRQLPRDRYPYLTGNLDAMMTGDGDDRFGFAVEMFIAGIAAQVR